MSINAAVKPAVLVLADGTIFHGQSIGAEGLSVGEVVFNTAMSGYQEILTDPSYASQIVTLTYPHIGNTGTNSVDAEAETSFVAGLVIRDLPLLASNWRSEKNLGDWLKERDIVAIADIDTRKLTRILREKGAQNGCLMTGNINIASCDAALRDFPGLKGLDLAKEVSDSSGYEWTEGSWELDDRRWNSGSEEFHVVAYDFGIKRNILRMLVDRGCRVTVVPAETPAEEVLELEPDGVFLSNGPGDPEPCDYAIFAIQQLLETNIPIFGICLGHQLLGLASGAESMKMKFGHHGANHPVQDLLTNVVMITSQNHGFALDEASLPDTLVATHRSLFDGSLQGVRRIDKPAFSFQGHPEASPGPHDVAPLFDQFIALMKEDR
ncbi:MAG: glutamine-hydrolyzing carbamoyl-phosphate synthase small subunit [Xanthomonadales bacterium]|nr:glutamine-hydrolyzing carbamoyl-phosphate synthase small subunit [Xanthomonadales bacterium]